jgi:hypothetical protein
MTTLLSHISSTPITINALSKASGLGATALALALVGLGGQVTIQDGGVVLAVAPVATPKVTGPRGPNAATKPRLEIARNALLSLASVGPVDAVALLAHVGETALYTDILLVAREECAKGTIVETRKGRKAIWSLPVAEIAQVEPVPAE